jgi:hypothetical protein
MRGEVFEMKEALTQLLRIKVAGPNEAFIVTGRKGRTIRTTEVTVRSVVTSGIAAATRTRWSCDAARMLLGSDQPTWRWATSATIRRLDYGG